MKKFLGVCNFRSVTLVILSNIFFLSYPALAYANDPLFFPSRYLQTFHEQYPAGTQTDILRRQLEQENFGILHYENGSWMRNDLPSGHPPKLLSDRILGFLTPHCSAAWARFSENPRLLFGIASHRYNFAWVECDGVVQSIHYQHYFWSVRK